MVSIWAWISIALFGLLLICLELGYRVGRHRLRKHTEEANKAPNLLSGSIYGLMSLLLSFTFAIAMQRFDARRHLVVDEANAVGTAYLRVDLLPRAEQPRIRQALRQYADARLEYGNALAQGRNVTDALNATNQSQRQIWTLAMSAYQRDPHESTRVQLTPALNEMFDLAASRTESVETHVPFMILVLLIGVCLSSALLAGRDLAARTSRTWGHRILFSAVLASVIYVVSDLDDPRQGFIRIDRSDHILRDVRSYMND